MTVAVQPPVREGAASPVVRVEGVHKSFGSLKVLDGVDLSVSSGECLVIVGPSGSGKSTLLRCINALETIDAGRIVVDGMVVGARGTSIRALRAEVGMVFQQFNLFPDKTVRVASRLERRFGRSGIVQERLFV